MNNAYAITKYEKLCDRLREKVKMSATPINGFMIGLSGTDSILTYMMLNDVSDSLKGTGHTFKVRGVHYVDDITIPTSFQKLTLPYLIANYVNTIECVELKENLDQYRWANLHIRAVNQKQPHWVVSTVNATEKALGTYSIMSKSASIEPIASLWKSDVLAICQELGVPEKVLESSRIPDCACGREEFASENIELIDALLRDNIPSGYSMERIKLAMDYIRNTKKEFGFKARTPYNV